MKISKTFHFEAAHHLPGHSGPCVRVHGHSYKLEVILEGPVLNSPGDSSDGMVMDFGAMSAHVKRLIIDKVDHQDLNEVLSCRPTAESMLDFFWWVLKSPFGDMLHTLRLWETESAYAEITADG